MHLVEQARVEALPRHLAAVDADVTVPGDLARRGDGRLDALGDEHEVVVRRRSVLRQVVSQDHRRDVHGVAAAPGVGHVEQVPAHQ